MINDHIRQLWLSISAGYSRELHYTIFSAECTIVMVMWVVVH